MNASREWLEEYSDIDVDTIKLGDILTMTGSKVETIEQRGNDIKNVVVGNSTELKNVILFNKVQVPHYNYVGDSILGYKAHMGAGSITSNVRSDKKLVVVKDENEKIETGLKKVGAMIGDGVEVGCGSILNPGSVVGKNTNIYPLSSVRCVVPPNSIYKNQNEITDKQ